MYIVKHDLKTIQNRRGTILGDYNQVQNCFCYEQKRKETFARFGADRNGEFNEMLIALYGRILRFLTDNYLVI